MRTKSIILSAIVGALSSVSLMAQVYSLNAVGYINVTCPSGFSIIANQLVSSNNNISPLLDSQLLDGAHDGVIIFKYEEGSFVSFVVNSSAAWSSSSVTSTTMNPGEAVFIYNPFGSSFNLTFVGQVPQGSIWATNSLVQGFNLISSIVPQSAALDTGLGLTPTAGDIVFQLEEGSYVSDVVTSSLGWSSGSAPVPPVGSGFFYYSVTGENWVNNFSVN